MASVPFGYLRVNHPMCREQIERLRDEWTRCVAGWEAGKHLTPVLGPGVEFVPFEQHVTPDAFCIYCGTANLDTSAWCQGCGAPMIREGRK